MLLTGGGDSEGSSPSRKASRFTVFGGVLYLACGKLGEVVNLNGRVAYWVARQDHHLVIGAWPPLGSNS